MRLPRLLPVLRDSQAIGQRRPRRIASLYLSTPAALAFPVFSCYSSFRQRCPCLRVARFLETVPNKSVMALSLCFFDSSDLQDSGKCDN